MKTRKIITFTALFLSVIVLIVGCTGKKESLDWQLHGAWISEDGVIGEQVQMSLSGSIPSNCETREQTTIQLDICWPESLSMRNVSMETLSGYANTATGENAPRNFWCSTYIYIPDVNDVYALSFVLYPDEGFVVFQWPFDIKGYLIASTDQNADFSQLYQRFCDTFLNA